MLGDVGLLNFVVCLLCFLVFKMMYMMYNIHHYILIYFDIMFVPYFVDKLDG